MLVEVDSAGGYNFGRPATPLDLGKSSLVFLGVALRGSSLCATVTDVRCNQIEHFKSQRPVEQGPLLDHIIALTEIAKAKHRGIAGIGLVLGDPEHSAQAAFRKGKLLYPEIRGAAALIEKRTGMPTSVETEARALAQFEHWFGAGREARSMIVIAVRSTVSCGIIVHDRLVHGFHGTSGSIGSRGVEAQEATGNGDHRSELDPALTWLISSAASEILGQRVSSENASRSVVSKLSAAQRQTAKSGRALGALVITIADLLDPELLIVSGGDLDVTPLGRAEFEDAIAKLSNWPDLLSRVSVRSHVTHELARAGAAIAIRYHVSADDLLSDMYT